MKLITTLFSALALSASLSIQAANENRKVVNATVKHTDEAVQLAKDSTIRSVERTTPLPSLSAFKAKARAAIPAVVNADTWIYDSWVTVSQDRDFDRYYTRFDLELDVDTIFSVQPIYAVVYLGRNDVFESVSVSSVFDIFGNTDTDSVRIEHELVSGYIPHDYEILVEVYDAISDELIAVSDGQNDADLAFVSLESENYDSPPVDTVVVVEEHGGSVTIWFIAFLMLLVVCRIYWKVNSDK